MASQISHIIYGKRIFNKLDSKFEWADFVIGTTFPDIRQLAKVDRNILHKISVSLDDILSSKTSFDAGLYTHSYVDEKREEFLKKEGVYRIIGSNPVSVASLKLVEDGILYDLINNWSDILKIYDLILDEELEYIDRPIVEKWHKYLKLYFSKKPNEEVWRQLITTTTVYKDMANDIIDMIAKIKKEGKVLDIIKEIYNIF